MSDIKGSIYYNGDDCFLSWKMPERKDCWGFAIHRKIERKGKTEEYFLDNRTGFEGDNNPANAHESSEKWPFQRYTWTDHGVDEGDTVTYKIYPVIKKPGGMHTDKEQEFTLGPVTTTSCGSGRNFAYFNRGIVLSQFMARRMVKDYGPDWGKKDLVKMKKSLENDDSELRHFLMGQLGDKLISLLQDAKKNDWDIYAALYEFDDDAIISAVMALGKKAHIILSNGSKKKLNEDGNKEAFDKLGKKVDLHRRMLWSEGLAHNKFLVFAKPGREPFMVWTGSLNWATTGLCTQLNNGILVEDKKLADVFFAQWKLLRDDTRAGKNREMHFGEKLMDSNDSVKSSGSSKVWFTRTSEGQDMAYVTELINKANEAILFLMFEPGKTGLLQVIQSRLSPASKTYNKDLYVHGVVNTLQNDKSLEVEVVSRGNSNPFNLKIVQPEGMNLSKYATEVFRREVQRGDFMMTKGGVIGYAIIHSKIIVIDPFTKPVVITGSHNFSTSASTKNDENLIIIEGNKELAERYFVNIMATYQHFRWRGYLKENEMAGGDPWSGLKKSDKWQIKQADKNQELRFWVR